MTDKFNAIKNEAAEKTVADLLPTGPHADRIKTAFKSGFDLCAANLQEHPKVRILIEALEKIGYNVKDGSRVSCLQSNPALNCNLIAREALAQFKRDGK